MKLKFNRIIKGVNSICARNEYIILEKRVYNLKNGLFLEGIDNQNKVLCFGEDYIISSDLRGNTNIVNLKNLTSDCRFRIDSSLFPYLSFYEIDGNEKNGIYDYNNQKVLFETQDWIGRNIFDEFIINDNVSIITCRKITSKMPEWEVNLEMLNISQEQDQDLEIKKIIDIYKNQLLISLEGNVVISLDVGTGKLLNKFNIYNTFPELTDFQKDTFTTSYHLDEENNRLIILSNTALYHINLITNRVSLVKDYHDVPQQEQWRFMSATLYNGKLYFTGDLGLEYVVATRIGVMDIETGEILWQEQLKKTGGLPNAPQVTQDKLYVLTVNKQLYIFQKDDTIS